MSNVLDTFHFDAATPAPVRGLSVEHQILEQVQALAAAVERLAAARSASAQSLIEERNRVAADNRRLRETHQIVLGYLDELEKILVDQGAVRQRLQEDAR